MFTGIVKDVGRVSGVMPRSGGLRLRVHYSNAVEFAGLSVDESVSLSGVCQTVVALGEGWFEVDSVEETLAKTTFGSLRSGSRLNLERAVRPMDRLGGHFVLGHVDCAAPLDELKELGSSRELWFSLRKEFSPYIVSAGSITIDGVSLTVARLEEERFAVAVIPYTIAHTTIEQLRKGSMVNLEFDILGKYVARRLAAHSPQGSALPPVSLINEEWLREQGF
ncbi:MAG: riboflavin synthase [Chlorobiaceae bacterium]|nr:riboflavin synthase [Chlorobiaceae bacterium]NTW11364.1 riboflavin synthase [Chlorobiaceae bacterium]